MDAGSGGAVPRNNFKSGPALGGRGVDPVTAGLKQLFAAVESEPIPDDFMRLLDEIDAARDGDAGKPS